jgi:DNA-binding LacI/PurR family transcriptional regulator
MINIMIDLKRVLDDLKEPSSDSTQVRLRDILAEQLTDGTLHPGDRFSSATVLQEHLKIGSEVIYKVLQELIDTGLLQTGGGDEIYVLGQSSASPAGNPMGTVGLLAGIPAFHFFYGQLAAAFNQRLQEAGWALKLALFKDQDTLLQEVADQMMQQYNVRAFAINPPQFNIQPFLDALRARGTAIQLLGTGIYYPEYDFIGADNQQIGYQATRHLIELGHTQIVYAGAASYPAIYDRTQGYITAMHESGLRPRIFNVHSLRDFTLPPEFRAYQDPENTPTALWREMVRHRITAAFCFNYIEATWVHDEILKFNLQIPRDVSIITVGHPPTTGYRGAVLTTFALPGKEIGHQAANLMLRRLAGEDFPPQKILLPGEFILQSSTSAPHEQRTAQK